MKSSYTTKGNCEGNCVCEYSVVELKDIMDDFQLKGREKLKNKNQMCRFINEFVDRGIIDLDDMYLDGTDDGKMHNYDDYYDYDDDYYYNNYYDFDR